MRHRTDPVAPRWVPWALVSLTVALGAVRIGTKSLWFDEAIAVAIARQPTGRFAHILWNDEANMSLYYTLLRAWVAVGGDGEVWIRSLSVLMAAAAVWVTYRIGARLFGWVTGAVAGLVLAANAFFVQFAQEARSYMLTALAAAVATLAFVRGSESPRRTWWGLYVGAVTAGVYAHLFALAVPSGHATALWLGRRDRGAWRRLGLALALVAALILPALRVAWVRRGTQVWWNPPVTLDSIRGVFAASAGGGGPALALATYALVAVAALDLAGRLRRHGRGPEVWPWAVALSGYAVPSAAILTVSVAQRIVQIRYFSVMLPALALVVAVGVARIGAGRRNLGVVALIVLLVLQARGLHRWYTFSKEDWRGAMAAVSADGRDGDAVVLFDPYRLALVEYHRPDPWAGPGPRLVYPGPRFEPFPLYRDDRVAGPATARRAASTHDRVWVLISEADDPTRVGRFRAALRSTHRRAEARDLFRVRVERYDLR